MAGRNENSRFSLGYEFFHDRVKSNATAYPDKAALFFPEASAVTYGELARRVAGVREYLIKRGIGPGVRVILAAPHSATFVYAYIALLSLGATAIPLDVQTTECGLQIVQDMTGAKVGFWTGCAFGLEDIAVFDGMTADVWEKRDFDPAGVGHILFTSGTTSLPKGVCHSHYGIACAINNIIGFVGNIPSDIEINVMPLNHAFGLGRLLSVLYVGGTAILIPSVIRAQSVFDTMRRRRVTGLGIGVPAWNILHRLSGDAIAEFRGQLRYMELGTAAMGTEDKKTLAALLPETKICLNYGLTEAPRSAFLDLHEDKDAFDTMGRPTPLSDIQIFDDAGVRLLDGAEGEICVRGNFIMDGYLNQGNADGVFWGDFFRTGDLGRKRPDGRIVYTGRIKDIINVGGKKISPMELDLIIARLPGIADVACVGIPDELTGEQLVACLVAAGEQRLGLNDLKTLLHGTLEEYKMPQSLRYVAAIPRTASGKVQRARLVENMTLPDQKSVT